MDKNYIIIPGCCDLNRGDQALGWETCRIAQDAGFIGKYSILAEREEPIDQSIKEGFEILTPILEHPSRKFKNKDNIVYGMSTKIKWGLVALKDLVYSLLILKSKQFRKRVIHTSKDEKLVHSLKAFMDSDAIFMKGGGLIQSHGGIISTYATYYRIYHILLGHALAKPVYILPNSFGPFEGPFVKRMVKKAFKECQFISSRELKSKEVVKRELKMDIPCFPDLAFYLENGHVDKEQLWRQLNISQEDKVVAITMRPYRFPNSADPVIAYENFKKEMRNFIIWLNKKGYLPLIIEHTLAITSHENDGDCIKDVVEGIDLKQYRFFTDRNLNCRELKRVYSFCDYIIGTRFHSLIFSLSNRVPGIAISYDGYKSIGIMKDMGLEDYVIDIADVNCNSLCNMFESVIANKMEIVSNIDNYVAFAVAERDKLIEGIKG